MQRPLGELAPESACARRSRRLSVGAFAIAQDPQPRLFFRLGSSQQCRFRGCSGCPVARCSSSATSARFFGFEALHSIRAASASASARRFACAAASISAASCARAFLGCAGFGFDAS